MPLFGVRAGGMPLAAVRGLPAVFAEKRKKRGVSENDKKTLDALGFFV